MLREIYYFSGTGNSLAVARDLANKMKAKLIPISWAMNNEDTVIIDADVTGIVFPVYHSGLPVIMRNFIEKTQFLGDPYVFAVCTYGGLGPGAAVRYLRTLIRPHGGLLSAGWAVKMPYNYLTTDGTLLELTREEKLKMFDDWELKRDAIIKAVNAKQKGPFETTLWTRTGPKREPAPKKGNVLDYVPGSVLLAGETRRDIWQTLPTLDGNFYRDDDCICCGICVEICPVGNIDMEIGGPVWLHECEQCFACLQWCPNGSLQFGDNTAGGKRYHHPDVVISDMIGQRKPL